MTNMVVEVEFLAGTKIHDALTEAKNKALDWDVSYVRFKFNGYIFSIGRNADISKCIDQFDAHVKTIISS